MAVKTDFSAYELKQLLANYNIGNFLDCRPINEGTVQTNIRIQTTNGQFVFRYYENRTQHSVLFETTLLRFLRNHHYPCPEPIRNRNGEDVGIYHAKPYVVFEFIEGQHVQKPTERHMKQLIQKAAELHTITKDYVPIHKESRWNYSIDFCRQQAEQESVRINTLNSKQKLIWLKKELTKLNLPESLPKGICHCDFHLSNMLFMNDEFSALLDFDDANYTYLLFDLVGLMETWAWRYEQDKSINFSEAKKIVQEYMKHRPLTEVEKTHLYDVYKLSIIIDCIWFFERGEIADFYEKGKIDCLEQIGREKFYQGLFN